MTNQLSFGRILRRSLVHRKARSLSALVAMTVSAGVATALLTLYADLDAKLHKEFRSFGANIVITAPAPQALAKPTQQASNHPEDHRLSQPPATNTASNLSTAEGHAFSHPVVADRGPNPSATEVHTLNQPTTADTASNPSTAEGHALSHPVVADREPRPSATEVHTLNQPPTADTASNPSVAEGHAFRRAKKTRVEDASALPKASLSSLQQAPPSLEPGQQPDIFAAIQHAAGPDALAAGFAYAVATTDRGTPVVVAGVDFGAVRKLNAWWQVDSWPSPTDTNAAILGQRAANFIADERSVTLNFAAHSITLHGTGRLRTGGDEDSRIYIPIAAFATWTGVQPTVFEVQVPGGAARVNSAIAQLRQQLPGMKVEPVRQLVEGESRIVEHTHALMYGAVILIALTVAVSVLATLSASVLERRRDFALMKALGGSQVQLMGIFLLEALILALAGVIAGFFVGSAAAWLISEVNFHTASLPRLQVLPLVLLLNVLIAAMASLFPVRVLRGLQPAALLKGE